MHRIRADSIIAAVRYQVLIEREYDVRPQMRRRLQDMVKQVELHRLARKGFTCDEQEREDLI